jgi:hypothetical protein
VNVVGDSKLSDEFIALYNDLRIRRNKIVHLDSGSVAVEASNVLVSILDAQYLLFGGQIWQIFLRSRMPHLSNSHEEDDDLVYEEDISHDTFLTNLEEVIQNLKPAQVRRFIGFDKRKRRLDCPSCCNLVSKHYDGELRYAQKQKDNSIFCFGCLMKFADQDSFERFAEL